MFCLFLGTLKNFQLISCTVPIFGIPLNCQNLAFSVRTFSCINPQNTCFAFFGIESCKKCGRKVFKMNSHSWYVLKFLRTTLTWEVHVFLNLNLKVYKKYFLCTYNPEFASRNSLFKKGLYVKNVAVNCNKYTVISNMVFGLPSPCLQNATQIHPGLKFLSFGVQQTHKVHMPIV